MERVLECGWGAGSCPITYDLFLTDFSQHVQIRTLFRNIMTQMLIFKSQESTCQEITIIAGILILYFKL